MNVVLHEGGLLAIMTGVMKGKIEWGGRVKAIIIRNVIRKFFVNQAVDGVHAGLQVMMLEGGGDGSAEVPFAKPAVLKHLHWRGMRIGNQAGLHISHSRLDGSQQA